MNQIDHMMQHEFKSIESKYIDAICGRWDEESNSPSNVLVGVQFKWHMSQAWIDTRTNHVDVYSGLIKLEFAIHKNIWERTP